MAQVWLDKTELSNEMVRLAMIEMESGTDIQKHYAAMNRLIEHFPHSDYINDSWAKWLYEFLVRLKPSYGAYIETLKEES